MKIDNVELNCKIAKYHDMLRKGQNIDAIKNEISVMTKDYTEKTNIDLNFVQSEFHNVQTEIKTKTSNGQSIRKEYIKLIDLYRKACDISKDISRYKKSLRDMNGK